jgi:hypothetical protein
MELVVALMTGFASVTPDQMPEETDTFWFPAKHMVLRTAATGCHH